VSARPLRFVILAAPRTGSNMLCTLLDSHPDVLCHHELFNPAGVFTALDLRDGGLDLGGVEERDGDPLGFLDRVWASHLGHAVVGFKMTHRQNEAVFAAVLRDPGVRKIVLRRDNRVRTYVSRLVAEQTGRWEAYDEAELVRPRPSVHVDPEALRASVAENEAYYAEIEEVLRETRQASLAVIYERLPDERARLLEFLGLPEPRRAAASLRVRSVRQNAATLSELVSNAAELQAALAGTDLEPDLHAPDPYRRDSRGRGLLDERFAADELTGGDPWATSHGAEPRSARLGAGMLYYALAYALRASVCVCLGSGGGFVPRLMRQAQRDLGLAASRTILVDGADLVPPERRRIWGSPSWTAPDSWFRTHFPDIDVVISLTEDAHRDVFLADGIAIDYLHIDADHHYDGVRRDFDLYAPLVADGGVITLHDTANRRPPCGVPRLVEELRRDDAWSVVDVEVRYGTAIVQRNRPAP
jgi:hypothetical protein